MKLVVASTNAGKLAEFRQLLTGFEISGEGGLEVEETGDTFEANARLKARAYCEKFGTPALADDSGLCVKALDGRPGVYSARYAPDDAARISRLLNELRGASSRAAWFECALVLAQPDGSEVVARGRCDGQIIEAPRGTQGFGYDPIFVPDGFSRTFAELSREEKSALSHRGRALAQLKRVLAR